MEWSRAMDAMDAEKAAAEADCVVIVTDHKAFDYSQILSTREADRGHAQRAEGPVSDKIVRL